MQVQVSEQQRVVAAAAQQVRAHVRLQVAAARRHPALQLQHRHRAGARWRR